MANDTVVTFVYSGLSPAYIVYISEIAWREINIFDIS